MIEIVKIGKYELEYIIDSLLLKRSLHGLYLEKNIINDECFKYFINNIKNFQNLKCISFNGILLCKI